MKLIIETWHQYGKSPRRLAIEPRRREGANGARYLSSHTVDTAKGRMMFTHIVERIPQDVILRYSLECVTDISGELSLMPF